MLSRWLRWAGMLVLVVGLAACGGSDYAQQTQNVDGLTITFEHPAQAELLKNYDLTVTLTDAAKKPVEGADVSLKLDMPAMPMADTQPVADSAGNGRYRVNTTYNMAGDWLITVNAEVDGKTHKATFEQKVVPQK